MTEAQAFRAASRVFCLAALNSGVSTSLRIDSVVGAPALRSRTIGTAAAFSISLSPSSAIAWARLTWSSVSLSRCARSGPSMANRAILDLLEDGTGAPAGAWACASTAALTTRPTTSAIALNFLRMECSLRAGDHTSSQVRHRRPDPRDDTIPQSRLRRPDRTPYDKRPKFFVLGKMVQPGS